MSEKPKLQRVARPKPDLLGAFAFSLAEARRYMSSDYPAWWGPVAEIYGELGLSLEKITWPDGSHHAYYSLPGDVGCLLAAEAEYDAEAFALACNVCASSLEARVAIPVGMELFASKVLRGELNYERQPQTSLVKHWKRDTALFYLVWALEKQFGLVANPRPKSTENEVTRRRERPPSASAIIFEAFHRAGYKPKKGEPVITDNTAAKVWGDRNVRRRIAEARARRNERLQDIVRRANSKGANVPDTAGDSWEPLAGRNEAP